MNPQRTKAYSSELCHNIIPRVEKRMRENILHVKESTIFASGSLTYRSDGVILFSAVQHQQQRNSSLCTYMHGTLYRKLNGMFGKEHIFVDGNCKIQRVVTIQKLVIIFFLLQAEGKKSFQQKVKIVLLYNCVAL